MRVDELVAGVKSQIGVKLFGENIEILKTKADKIAKELSKIEGATDIRVEPIAGQSYLTIKIDRDKIARYGINVAEVQEIEDFRLDRPGAGGARADGGVRQRPPAVRCTDRDLPAHAAPARCDNRRAAPRCGP